LPGWLGLHRIYHLLLRWVVQLLALGSDLDLHLLWLARDLGHLASDHWWALPWWWGKRLVSLGLDVRRWVEMLCSVQGVVIWLDVTLTDLY
jgi:hypothetical protein